ncbi:AGE family epimerase/isomerase [Oscillatoria sp. FACHB-1407]|uniref:AGE family epimerase/isomerase n=1 Tax=Oscillatoria sp. FACHB-1407 TaxID=2692847 RepID=UPI0016881D96|nr:AGE family epimerase/isomerase [Oscillatoria sp. FACHB-1407]MBD2459418.1 AGE family epimerase/isomerase [Oscillatoria sp. FACHB-1407]
MFLSQPSSFSLLQASETLERILLQNIVPFWYPQTLDRQEGGYRLNHDLQSQYQGASEKYLVSQARTLWFFSRLSNSPYGTDDHRKAAQHGYQFLRDRLWDKEYGGFYWIVDASGATPLQIGKHLYGQAFALYALSEYAIASQDTTALELANQLFTCLEQYAYDAQHGGYRECFQRDWQPMSTKIGYLGVPPTFKLLNTHLHLLEAFTIYYSVTQDVNVHKRLMELIVITSNAVVRKQIGVCTDQHHLDWTPVNSRENQQVSYGHMLETVWLLAIACQTVELSNHPLLDLYRSFFRYALQYGCDRRRGGFYESGYYNTSANQRKKIWWVQAECLVAALQMYQLTKEDLYLQCFYRTLDWIVKYQVDWQQGEWYMEILPNGQPSGCKAGAWKAPYHNGRAMLQCLALLTDL